MSSTHTSVPHSSTCWSCQGVVVKDSAFCPACDTIQPLDLGQDFFQVFSLPMAFPMALSFLEAHYQALQKQFHPDRFATRSAKERRLSLEHVTHLNTAYQTLRDPLSRSAYLLERLGNGHSDSDQAPPADPIFLMEMMEARETLESINLQSEHAVESLRRLRAQTERSLRQEQEKMAHLFERAIPSPEPALLEQIAQANSRSRYHQRFLEALDSSEEQLYEGYEF